MTHSDLQWLRSEMERVIELGEKGTPRPWTVEDPIGSELTIVQANLPTYVERAIAGVPQGDLEDGFPQEVAEANARLIVAAVNYSAAWARHVLRVIERVYECKRCGGIGGRCVIPENESGGPIGTQGMRFYACSVCESDREDLSALIADMRKSQTEKESTNEKSN